MSLPLALVAMKLTAVVAMTVGVFFLGYGVARRRTLPCQVTIDRYVAYLDRQLRTCFMKRPATKIVRAQATLAGAALAAYVVFQWPLAVLAAALALVAPALHLRVRRRNRAAAINAEADGFILALAGSLKAVPNIGAALAGMLPVLRDPLRQEIGLVLSEMRVGSSVDQALLAASARCQSAAFDAAVSALLVGRRVGGDVPKVLETTASTIREMSRLETLVRTKTAESRGQLWVLAAFPVGIGVMFSLMNREYFDPLQDTLVGHLVALVIVTLWVVSLVVARSMTKVDL